MALLTNIQNAVVGRLSQEEFFSQATVEAPKPVAVLAEQAGDVQARIQQHLGTRGIVCVVLTATATTGGPIRQRPCFDEIKVVVRVQENVTLNRAANGTGQPASLVAEAVAWFLHGFAPEGVGGALRAEAIRRVADSKLLVYEAAFVMEAGMKEAPARTTAGGA